MEDLTKQLKEQLINMHSPDFSYENTYKLSYDLTLKKGYKYVLDIFNEILCDRNNKISKKDLKLYYYILFFPVREEGINYDDFESSALKNITTEL